MAGAFSLVFETSTPQASLARIAPGGVVTQRGFHSDRNHNAMLFEPLEELLNAGQKLEIELVLVGSGPGSYSGTRVGIAAAQGVAIASGCPAIAVPSIVAVQSAQDGLPCLAIGDARRGSFWSARVENFRLADKPALCDGDELVKIVSQALDNEIPVFCFEDSARRPLTDHLAGQVKLEFPDATLLWKAWLAATEETRLQWSTNIPQPLYLKPPHITPAKRSSLLRPC